MFATAIFVLVVGFYSITYGVLRARMARLGGESVHSIAHATREANELFAAAKELLLSGNFRFFIVRVRTSLGKAFKADAVSRMVQVMPKHVIELVAFSALLLIPIYRSWVGESYRDFLPVMALFAYAGYRLLPSGQQVYASFSILKYYDTLAVRFLDVLNARPGQYAVEGHSRISQLSDVIRLSQVSFCYPDKEQPAVSGVSLTIKRHEKVAIIGPSGSGKSTLLDIVLGLLTPTSGELVVNGTVISSSAIPWDARTIGYVPQSPLMVRATIVQNIAFGVSNERIDRQQCKLMAEFACVNDVIEKLPDGYDTLLGDGLSLSGGETQRLAIARALYFSPDILVLDEPSSALDPIISSRLFRRLSSAEFACTVVVVTHDWDILPGFDKIIVVDQGIVVAEGSYVLVREYIESLRKKTAASSV
ncbi:hypothetical protein B566_EDAN000378 [Ephemera danica]|nr:hypothetical protein B566_EDAN000378 [Ephemera danica]